MFAAKLLRFGHSIAVKNIGITTQSRFVVAMASSSRIPTKPIKLFYAGTPNGIKPIILTEELGLNVEYIKIDMSKAEQKEDWFLQINPNGRIPAMIDPNEGDINVFESAAIMIYLNDAYGNDELMPNDKVEKSKVMAWLMFQMGGVGPMFGQAFHFLNKSGEPDAYGQMRYVAESRRLVWVLEVGLDGKDYLAGDRITLADMATIGWVAMCPLLGIDLTEFPNTLAWYRRLTARPSVKKAIDITAMASRLEAFATDEGIQAAAEKAKERYAFKE